MTLSEIERQLSRDPANLLRGAGMPPDAADLPRRIRRAIAYYRRALTFAPLDALADDMRDQRFDRSLVPSLTADPAKVEQMCAAYERRARRQHLRQLARRIASRMKTHAATVD